MPVAIISSRKPVLIENPDAAPDTGEGLDRGEFIDNIRDRDVVLGDETGALSLAKGGGNTDGITIAAPSITMKGADSSPRRTRSVMKLGNISLRTGTAIFECSGYYSAQIVNEPAESDHVLAQNGISLAKQSYLFSGVAERVR